MPGKYSLAPVKLKGYRCKIQNDARLFSARSLSLFMFAYYGYEQYALDLLFLNGSLGLFGVLTDETTVFPHNRTVKRRVVYNWLPNYKSDAMCKTRRRQHSIELFRKVTAFKHRVIS
ncbi:hypothetical protein Zmor_024562 [Zophobas morio]|uniref:Uncharacterized protein n=1 Tax=Zophobas morio TaxID=2755281 RepID=A0AA38I0G3_9CUCU|nr:hypothetical protein Zmor_024562 [Zophobas morio]